MAWAVTLPVTMAVLTVDLLTIPAVQIDLLKLECIGFQVFHHCRYVTRYIVVTLAGDASYLAGRHRARHIAVIRPFVARLKQRVSLLQRLLHLARARADRVPRRGVNSGVNTVNTVNRFVPVARTVRTGVFSVAARLSAATSVATLKI